MMDINIICHFIKFLGINYSLTFCFYKIIHYSRNLTFSQKLITLIVNIIFSIVQSIIITYISAFFTFIPIIFLYGFLLGKLSKLKFERAIVASIISLALSYTISLFSMYISSMLFVTFKHFQYMNYVSFICSALFNILFCKYLFKSRRLKYGFSFLENDYLNLLVLLIATIIIVSYVLGGSYTKDYLACALFLIAIIAFIIIKQAFILYQKQKLQTQTLKDYEKQLSEVKQKLQVAIEEKDKVVKANHEFFHRQEALKNKLNSLASQSFNCETAEEFSSVMDRIDNLSKEYADKTAILPKLVPTNISEIDDMLIYMQKECAKNRIEFVFKLECNISKILNNYISKSELETLLGDLIRNAIIAINHSNSSFRNIMVVFGLKDSIYQIDIYDSGIQFEAETLLKLGLEKASTHLNEGGTGIGFLTTFETLNNTKASFVITEFEDNKSSYTKALTIKFNDLNNYIIKSPRANSIKNANVNNRNIIFE